MNADWEMAMAERGAGGSDGAARREVADDALDDLEPEVVEDLEVDEKAEDVRGGSLGCITF